MAIRAPCEAYKLSLFGQTESCGQNKSPTAKYSKLFDGVSQQWFYLCVDQNSKTCYIAYKKGLHNKEFNSWTFKTFSSSKLTGDSSAKAYDHKQQITFCRNNGFQQS